MNLGAVCVFPSAAAAAALVAASRRFQVLTCLFILLFF
jgi:hypothetical protein